MLGVPRPWWARTDWVRARLTEELCRTVWMSMSLEERR